jgi:cysteine desulfurase
LKTVYLDNAATTAVRPEALESMLPFLRGDFANPSSAHASGQRARNALDQARLRTARALGAAPKEIVFTGGGSEADCLALFGIVEAHGIQHFITSAIEHHAVLHAADALRERGVIVSVLPVNREGFVELGTLEHALDEGPTRIEHATTPPTLVSVMHANNEIGTIQDVSALAKMAHARGAFFHTDAVQTVGHIELDVRALDVDALSLSAHKFEGPKGVGALYVREGVRVTPRVYGGGQESGMRAGTENVAGIAGLSVALELAVQELASERPRIEALRDRLIDGVLKSIPGAALNGSRERRLPNNANLRFDRIEAHTLVLGLDVAGFETSTGSACTSGSLDPSHVLSAIGTPGPAARGALRFSLGRQTQSDDIDRLLDVLPGIIRKLRALSPVLTVAG